MRVSIVVTPESRSERKLLKDVASEGLIAGCEVVGADGSICFSVDGGITPMFGALLRTWVTQNRQGLKPSRARVVLAAEPEAVTRG